MKGSLASLKAPERESRGRCDSAVLAIIRLADSCGTPGCCIVDTVRGSRVEGLKKHTQCAVNVF